MILSSILNVAFYVTLFLSINSEPIASNFKPLTPSESYTHYLDVDESNIEQYKVFWKLLDNNEIQFEVHCKTTGWVGLGLSPNGGMKGADIAIGWIDTKAQLKDCHSTDNAKPELDSEQNWILLDGAEYNGYTMLKYKRSLKTCDTDNDREIKQGTTFMIFAWNNADPINNDWKFHGNNKHIKQALLLNFNNEDLSQQGVLPADTTTFDLRMRNVKIKDQETYYFCDTFKLPVVNESIHLLQFEMLINPAHKNLIHHLLAFECDDGFEPSAQDGHECGYVNLPDNLDSTCHTRMFIAWGIGGQYNYSFPSQAGYPLIGNGKFRTILIELHYNNPNLIKNLIDDSGIRLYFSPTLRKYELGLLMVGAEGSPLSLQIPAQAESLTFKFHCYPQCFEKTFSDDGIYVISGFLHTHLAGRSIKTNLIRNGVLIQHLFDNPNYDFNYQYTLDIEPTKLMKGDALTVECEFNTKDRTNFTNFGFGTRDEMCYSFIYYYPKISTLEMCISEPTLESSLGFYKSLIDEGLIPNITLTVNDYYDKNGLLINTLRNTKSSEKLIQKYKEFYENDFKRYVYCGTSFDFQSSYFNGSIDNFKPYSSNITEASCSRIVETTTKSKGSFNEILVSFIIFSLIISIVNIFF